MSGDIAIIFKKHHYYYYLLFEEVFTVSLSFNYFLCEIKMFLLNILIYYINI